MRFRNLNLALCFAIALIASLDARAQFFDSPDETTAPEPVVTREDELIRQLESNAARGGTYRSESIRSLARLKAWPEVDRWIGTYSGVNDQTALATAASQIGSDTLLRISLSPELSDSGKTGIKKLLAAAKTANEDLGRLRKAIAELSSENVDANLNAHRVLMAGGNASIKALTEAIGQGLPNETLGKALSNLRSLGPGGAQALNQMALYGTPSVRVNAVNALRLLSANQSLDAMLTAAFALDASPGEREVARRSGLIPENFEVLDAVATLADRLTTIQKEALRAPNDTSPATLWSLNEDKATVSAQRSTEVYLRYRHAYDAAQRLRRLGALPPKVQRQVLAADLAYRVMVDIDWGSAEEIQQIREAYAENLGPTVLLTALRESLDNEDSPASVGIVRLIGKLHVSADDANLDLISGSGAGNFSPLVDAVRDSEPRIRYESAAAIANLINDQGARASFPGSSYYRKTLSEMASLDLRPTAIVLETRPVIALRQESILNKLGYRVTRASSGLQVERAIEKGGDLRFVISKIQISDVAPTELVDRIRRRPHGSRLPIVFYSDADSHEENRLSVELETMSNRWISEDTPAVYLVDLPGSPAAFSDVIAEVESKRRLPALSVGDRSIFRSIGTAALQGD